MGVTYRFIADPNKPSEALEWFRATEIPPVEIPLDDAVTLYFSHCGSLVYAYNGDVEPKSSPIATLVLPQVRRGVLWTVGEVRVFATPLRKQFPKLHKTSTAFRNWLAENECIYSNQRSENQFAYYLEGSVMNYDPPVYAFDSGLAALKSGQYFISYDDTDHQVNVVCQTLALRGVECTA